MFRESVQSDRKLLGLSCFPPVAYSHLSLLSLFLDLLGENSIRQITDLAKFEVAADRQSPKPVRELLGL
jgi:hypothetical protein